MNSILKEVKELISESIRANLPNVKSSELEENGMIYYMNAKDGTEFDWYVNNRLPEFMVFYNDKKNLGAVKLTLFKNGDIEIYVYDNHGENLCKEINTHIEFSEDEIFELAVILKNEADDKQIWDNSIERINSTIELSDEKFQEYRDNEQFYEDLKNRLKLYNSIAIVSKKITEEGWKVGYMVRDEQYNEQDSGWAFYAGNEDDDYIADKNNTIILRIHDVCNIDADIKNYIENPVGTSLIRISSNEFEIDNQTKEIYTKKRNGFDKNY